MVGNQVQKPRETSPTDSPSDRRIVCLLCTALGMPELDHLSAAERKEARDWMKLTLARELVTRITRTRDDLVIRAIIKSRVKDSLDPPFDVEAFFGAQPLLQRVSVVLHPIRPTLRHDNNVTILEACLADFDGDTVALYNEVGVGEDLQYRYYPQQFDEASGLPICLAGQEDSQYHRHEWAKNADMIASFWPVTTPNLHTMYVIDSGIKLKPGASIPSGTQTFKGNNCLYVEVPRPVCRSLKKVAKTQCGSTLRPAPWVPTC
jgi:hypothetical protein